MRTAAEMLDLGNRLNQRRAALASTEADLQGVVRAATGKSAYAKKAEARIPALVAQRAEARLLWERTLNELYDAGQMDSSEEAIAEHLSWLMECRDEAARDGNFVVALKYATVAYYLGCLMEA